MWNTERRSYRNVLLSAISHPLATPPSMCRSSSEKLNTVSTPTPAGGPSHAFRVIIGRGSEPHAIRQVDGVALRGIQVDARGQPRAFVPRSVHDHHPLPLVARELPDSGSYFQRHVKRPTQAQSAEGKPRLTRRLFTKEPRYCLL